MLFMLKHNSINAISKIAVKSLIFKTSFTFVLIWCFVLDRCRLVVLHLVASFCKT